jgi:photosystem II stability/assembly factor-like uncharacterized protein
LTYVRAVAIDPATPTTLYAGLVEDEFHPNWGVFKSSDGGGTWNAINTGLPSDFGVFALAINPVTPTTLYAAMDGYYSGGYGGGVFMSVDGGSNWNAVNNGLPTSVGFHALAIDHTTPSTLYAGAAGGGVFVSTDGGNTWGNNALTSSSVYALAINPLTTSVLYAGTDGGVFQSIDGGVTWNAVNNGLPTGVGIYSLAIDPANPSTLYAGTDVAGVFTSLDGGATWNGINNGVPTGFEIHAVAVSPVNSSMLYAGLFGGGFFTSTDGGNSWTEFDTGIDDSYFHAIVFDPLTPTTVYTGTCNDGVFVLH